MKTRPLTQQELQILKDWQTAEYQAKQAWEQVLTAGLYLQTLSISTDLSNWRNPPQASRIFVKNEEYNPRPAPINLMINLDELD
jgi:hypothetical protein